MKVLIREAAYGDLDRIHTWIARDRPRSADAVVTRILDSAERLGLFPQMGHSGRVRGTYEWAVPDVNAAVIWSRASAQFPRSVRAVGKSNLEN